VTVEMNGQRVKTAVKFGALVATEQRLAGTRVKSGKYHWSRAIIYAGVNWRGFLPVNTIARTNRW